MGRVFEQAEQYLAQLSFGEFVEIGTSRQGDDSSTAIIARWADQRNVNLITVDVDPINCNFVQGMELSNVAIVNSTGEEYLYKRIYSIRPICFLYLDNFDWDHHPDKTEQFVIDQQDRYAELGLNMNNVNCQRAHLDQMILALPHMAERCLVVCDDTMFNEWWGHYTGKSGAVIPFLLSRGFDILYSADSGIILGRGITVR